MMFIDRDDELNMLEDRWHSNRAEFLVIYGRRRVGKTELMTKFAKDKRSVYLLATYQSEKDIIRRFSNRLAEYFGDELVLMNPYEDWDSLFTYLCDKTKDERIIIIFDELPYLIERNRAFTSIIQRYWDEELSKTKIFLMLCGSSVSMMETEVLGYKSPLYGRRTGQMKIDPLRFIDAVKFFPNYDIDDKVRTYAVLGGLPAYLLEFNPKEGMMENIYVNFLRKDRFLYGEVMFLLREELKEPRNYFSILKSIAIGKRKLNEIAQTSMLERNLVGKYLGVLKDLNIVKREVPVTERNPARSKKGLYFIQDNYIRFWFSFVYPNLDLIETGETGRVERIIGDNFEKYVSLSFEDLAKELLLKLCEIRFTRIGSWWHGEDEIDLVALNENEEKILFGECKWRNTKLDKSVYEKLIERKEKVRWKDRNRKEYFALFSKSGFTNAMKKLAESEGIMLYDLNDVKRVVGE
jgi:AAA+ ATPase superfamily predicted ATPase